ncbi:helix-turn-helix transcriptional regulator [Candidatus Sumerlaeota bacterium]|nr:helix-turn-helix transcriptional regulator [Candidatus Sumerlaeota bacterium]
MESHLASRIKILRQRNALTQDQFGAKYNVSGPAVYKFEKGYVHPSLKLWLRFALDCGLSEKQTILLWIKSKLPERYREHIAIDDEGRLLKEDCQEDLPAYLHRMDRKQMREAIAQAEDLPRGLRELLLQDDELWRVFQPTGFEIYSVAEKFGMYPDAPPSAFADALRNIRIFLRQTRLG